MGIVNITRAVRKGAHVLIALYGESGSGKTYSAIKIARGLVGPKGKVGMLDTETGRGLIYANEEGGYDHADLTPPFTPERYIESIKEFESAGYDVLIIDSASHEWEGIGGVIETADANGKQGLVKWAQPKARHKKFVQVLLSTRMHLIICLRAKEKLVQTGSGPSAKIVSEGFVSVQDKRFIFETTVQLFMHNKPTERGRYTIEKCPQDLLGAFPESQKITVATGARIAEWVNGGAPVDYGLEGVKRAGEEAAEKGTEAFRAWWNSHDAAAHRDRLRPFLDNFRSIAQAADDEAAAQRQQAAPDARAADLEDPFGDRHAPAPAAVAATTAAEALALATEQPARDWAKFGAALVERINACERTEQLEAVMKKNAAHLPGYEAWDAEKFADLEIFIGAKRSELANAEELV